jgi:hypothetical protein
MRGGRNARFFLAGGFLIAIGLAIAGFLFWRAIPDLSPEFGVLPVPLPNGRVLYFKREARWIDYDEIALSGNPDPCKLRDEDVYRFTEGGPPTAFYRVNGNSIYIYSTDTMQSPKRDTLGVQVVIHRLGSLEWKELLRKYKDKGLVKVEVPVKRLDRKCR